MAVESDIDLYPSEENQCRLVLAGIYRDFLGKDSSESNLAILRDTAIKRFSEIGLVVSVDTNHMDVMDDGTFVIAPQIIIEGRFDNSPHDYERHAFEVQSGEADGIAGVITEKGFKEK